MATSKVTQAGPRVGESIVYKNRKLDRYIAGTITNVVGEDEVAIATILPSSSSGEWFDKVQYDSTGTYWGTWCYPDDLPEDLPGVTAPPEKLLEE